MPIATVSSATPKAILDLCAKRGIDAFKLASKAGFDSGEILNSSVRVPMEKVLTLWSEAENLTGDGMIAVEAARNAPFGAYKIIDYLIATASTAREGLSKAFRYYRLINTGFEIRALPGKNRFYLELADPFDRESLSGRYVEFVFAATLVRLRQTSGFDCRPKEVNFRHPAPPPANASRYETAFQGKVRFNQTGNLLVFDREIINVPQPHADGALCEMMEHHAQSLLKRASSADDFVSDLREIINEGLRRGDASLKSAARKMAMSRRAVQRKLNGEGTSYRRLLDELRAERSFVFLRQQTVDISEIAQSLGFSDTCSFYRAFKRWTGGTPQQYLQSRNEPSF